jgi:hypothetical protein
MLNISFPTEEQILAAKRSHPFVCYGFVPAGQEVAAGTIAKLIDPCRDGDKTFLRGIPCYAPDAAFDYSGLIPTTDAPIAGRVVAPALTQLGHDRVAEMLGTEAQRLKGLGATDQQIAAAKMGLLLELFTHAEAPTLADWVRSIGYVIAEPRQ